MIEEGKKYLVTGASGFLGQELCRQIVDMGGHVVAMARNEGNLIKLRQNFSEEEMYIFPGDVCDPCSVAEAMQDVSGVFHLAAFKHVTMAEEQARQCTISNIQGSMNVLEAVYNSDQCEFVITTSTDKAAQIKGVYGGSKYIVEKLFQQYSNFDKNTKYRVVRYGNVFWSTGSVLEIWKAAIERGEKALIVNNRYATRFYFTRRQAVQLIFDCLDSCDSARPMIPKMKATNIDDLAFAMIGKYVEPVAIESDDDYEKITGVKYSELQSSENLHETMDGKTFSNEVEQYTVEELIELI